MASSYIESIKFRNYRNFDQYNIEIKENIVLIVGNNGKGKTNILEAISLFSPGRGLRGSKFEHIVKEDKDNFAVETVMKTKVGKGSLSTSYDKNSHKRELRFNDENMKQSELANFLNIVWLTPQMEGFFLDTSSKRRRFLDRLVYNFYPEHAKNLNGYEKLIKERMSILQLDSANSNWLDIVENKISEYIIKIEEKRQGVIGILGEEITLLDKAFPQATFFTTPSYDYNLPEHIASVLSKNRNIDRLSKKTNFGPHRSDLQTIYSQNNKEAKHCSTGEQKALLMSIIIAQIKAIQKHHSLSPIILLDESLAHLDNARRNKLVDILQETKSQLWITSTESNISDYFSEKTQKISLT